MRKRLLQIFSVITFAISHAAAQDMGAALTGVWKGPWYRGMTSGVMTLEMASDGSGAVQFTNLDNFGQSQSRLSKIVAKENAFEFSAEGEGGSEFAARVQVIKNGEALRGTARYEGFPVKFELKRADR